jgi:hypothetical protein
MNNDHDELVDVVSAIAVGKTQVHLVFSDGKEGVVDLTEIIHGPVFKEIVDAGELLNFIVDPDSGTLVWSNGADIAPEVLWMKAAHIPRDF